MATHADAPGDSTAAVPILQEVVRFADLNLSERGGAEMLYARIRHASLRVCGVEGEIDSDLVSPARKACVRKAIDDAVTRVGNAKLTAVYEREGGVHTRLAAARQP